MTERECKPTVLPTRDVTKQADLFKVLSDPHRLRILTMIARADKEVCVCDLMATVPLLQPTVSHHLRVLRETGLVLSERRGTWVYYRLAPAAQEKLRAALDLVSGTSKQRRPLKQAG